MNNVGFNIWRSKKEKGEYEKVNKDVIPSKGDYAKYSFTDNDVISGETYYYKLEDIDMNGIGTMRSAYSLNEILLIKPENGEIFSSELPPTLEWISKDHKRFKIQYSYDDGQTIYEIPGNDDWIQDNSFTSSIEIWREFAKTIQGKTILWRIVGENEQGNTYSRIGNFMVKEE